MIRWLKITKKKSLVIKIMLYFCRKSIHLTAEMLRFVLLLQLCSSLPLTIYENARFESFDSNFILDTIMLVPSQLACGCECFQQTMCLTATYSTLEQRCTLFMAKVEQGIVTIMKRSQHWSILTFKNKTLPGRFSLWFRRIRTLYRSFFYDRP